MTDFSKLHQELTSSQSMAEITIIQLVTPNIDEYARYSIASACKYSQMHGYKCLIQRSKTVTDLHINWTKIDFLKTVLTDYSIHSEDSFVVLLDADTVIINPEKSIEYFMSKYGNPDIDIYMAADTPFSIRRKKKPNAGFVIVRNNEIGRKIITRWLDAAYTDGKKWNDTHPRNQLVYWNCVEPEFGKYQVVLPKKYFHKPLWWVPQPGESGKFLFHVTSTKGSSRSQKMGRLYVETYHDQGFESKIESFLNNNQSGIVAPLSAIKE